MLCLFRFVLVSRFAGGCWLRCLVRVVICCGLLLCLMVVLARFGFGMLAGYGCVGPAVLLFYDLIFALVVVYVRLVCCYG